MKHAPCPSFSGQLAFLGEQEPSAPHLELTILQRRENVFGDVETRERRATCACRASASSRSDFPLLEVRQAALENLLIAGREVRPFSDQDPRPTLLAPGSMLTQKSEP